MGNSVRLANLALDHCIAKTVYDILLRIRIGNEENFRKS